MTARSGLWRLLSHRQLVALDCYGVQTQVYNVLSVEPTIRLKIRITSVLFLRGHFGHLLSIGEPLSVSITPASTKSSCSCGISMTPFLQCALSCCPYPYVTVSGISRRGVRACSSRGSSGPGSTSRNIELPNGTWWLDKASHSHDIVYGQVSDARCAPLRLYYPQKRPPACKCPTV